MSWLTDPYGWWVEPFVDNLGMQRALWAGLLTALCCSVVGVWVVLRGMSFFGDALAHGMLPGVAIAFVAGGNPTIGALIAAVVMVGGINVVRNASPLPDDASIGLMFVGMLALSVVVLSADGAGYTGDLSRVLFGSVTGVVPSDLARLGGAAAVVVVGSMVGYRALLVSTFDETTAQMLGLRPRWAHAGLLLLLVVAVVGSFEVVGNLLVFAFLIAPPATAMLLVASVPRIMLAAVVIGAAAVVVGLLVSYHHDTAAGATMALVSVIGFALALPLASRRSTTGRSGHGRA